MYYEQTWFETEIHPTEFRAWFQNEKKILSFSTDITNYMAPEMTDKFTMASDVWAFGCILLELTTTSLYTQEEIMDKIRDIKEDSFVMEQIFEEISRVSKNINVTVAFVAHLVMKENGRYSFFIAKGKNAYMEIHEGLYSYNKFF